MRALVILLLLLTFLSYYAKGQSLGFYFPKMDTGSFGISVTKGGLTNNSVFSTSAAYSINSAFQVHLIYGNYTPIFNNYNSNIFTPFPSPPTNEFGDVQNKMFLFEGAITYNKELSEKTTFQLIGFYTQGQSKWINEKKIAAGNFDIINVGINPIFLLGKFSDRAKFRYIVGSRLSIFNLRGKVSAAYLKENEKMLNLSYELQDHSTFFDAQLLLGCNWNFFNIINNTFGITIPVTKVNGANNIFAPIALNYTLGIEINKLFKDKE